MQKFHLLPLLLVLIPVVVYCEESLVSILKASKDAVESRDIGKNMEIVNKHYFTKDKDQSVWYHALKDGRNVYGIEFTMEELLFTEKLIQVASAHYHSCCKLPAGVSKAQCFFYLKSMVTDLEVGVRRVLSPDYQFMPDEAKYGSLYASAGMLSAHLALIATNSFKYYENMRLSKLRVKPFIKVLDKIQDVLRIYVKDVKDWLHDQVSPAKICQMTDTLWKEFQQGCETRWVASARDRYDKEETENAGKSEIVYYNGTLLSVEGSARKRGNVVVMPESRLTTKDEPKSGSFDDEYLNTEESALDILKEFGGNKGISAIRFRVQVYDHINKKVIFEKYMNASPASKGTVVETLADCALKARSNYLDTFKDRLFLIKQTTALTEAVVSSATVRIQTSKVLLD